MTTYDQQPLSRRAVRQSERAETETGFTPFPPNQAAAAPDFSAASEGSRELWENAARRAAQPQPDAQPLRGRRSAAPPAPEPLTYATQSPSAPPAPQPDLPPTQALPRQEQPQYRVRDFSPEARRSTFEAAPPALVAPPAPVDLDYQTEVGVFPAPVPPAPRQQPAEQTFTRRELRAMQTVGDVSQDAPAPVVPEALQEPAPVAPAPLAPAQPVVPAAPAASSPAMPIFQPPTPEPAQAAPFGTASAPSPFEALFQPAPAPAAAVPAPAAPTLAESWPPAAAAPTPAALAAAAPPAPVEQPLPPAAPEPVANTGLTRALAEFDALTSAPPPDAAPWSPPPGHWTRQLDDDGDVETTLTRSIRSGHTATNALVLPGMPADSDIRGPLTSTGEVMLTGSIDLPRNLAATGATGRIERDGLDALFDINDEEINSTDSSPVRAIRAVSTHDLGHGVTHTQKPKSTRGLTVLLIAASAMAVAVAGLLAAAFVFNLF